MARIGESLGRPFVRAFNDLPTNMRPIGSLPRLLKGQLKQNKDTITDADKFDDIPDAIDTNRPRRSGEESRGSTDNGPGEWAQSPTRSKGVEYQEFITGMERGTEYRVDGVNFDGYDSTRNVLLDAKDWRGFPPANTDFWHNGALDEIMRQANAADGTAVEWHFSTESAKDAVDDLLRTHNLVDHITTVVTPN